MGHQTLMLPTRFLIGTYACVRSYLKLIGADYKYYKFMWRALLFGLVFVISVSNKSSDILNIPSGI